MLRDAPATAALAAMPAFVELEKLRPQGNDGSLEMDLAGVDATLVRVEGVGHSFGTMSGRPEVMERVKVFFDRTLKGE